MKKNVIIASAPAALIAGTLALSATNGNDTPAPEPEPQVGQVEEETVVIPHVPGIAPNQMNPIVAAPEYTFPASPNELLNLDRDSSNYGTWAQMDSLNDLYQLAETVRLRRAVERLTEAIEADTE